MGVDYLPTNYPLEKGFDFSVVRGLLQEDLVVGYPVPVACVLVSRSVTDSEITVRFRR